MAKRRLTERRALPLSEVWASYLVALDAAGRSPNTIATYRYAGKALIAVTGDLALDALTPDGVRRAIVQLRVAGRAPKTLRVYSAAWSALYRWAVLEGLIEVSPLDRVERPRVPVREAPGLSPEQLSRIAAVCEPRTLAGARDRAIILTLAATGLRSAELLRLRRADVVEESAAARYIHVIGKGNRERLIALQRPARDAIGRYLLLRGQDDEPALWISERGALAWAGLYAICRRRGDQAGVPGCHPHRFRRAALSLMLDAGLPEADVQRLAGHRSAAMTRMYTSYSQERRSNDALLEASPLERAGVGAVKRPRR